MNNNTTLGSGLIWIGREWWINKTTIPSEQEVKMFLQKAIDLGITFFDTAPAYWASEERLWRFLHWLGNVTRDSLFIATKCGEFWNDDGTTYVDHSFPAMKASIDRSISLLGKINLLQLHKSSLVALMSNDVNDIIKYTKSLWIPYFGVSISDIPTWMHAITMSEVDFIQLPYNHENQSFLDVIWEAKSAWKKVITNRPFWMGKLIPIDVGSSWSESLLERLFHDVIATGVPDVVLTGTKTAEHLVANKIAFDNALLRHS